METIDAGISSLTKSQAKLGVIQSAVTSANETMSIQSDTLQTQLHDLDAVDPVEAGARVQGLMQLKSKPPTLLPPVSAS